MLQVLRHSNYRIYWAGALVSFIGAWLQTTALSWLVRSLTPSPFMLGLVAFCGSAPMFVFSLFGGVLADRLDKKRVLYVTQAILGFFAGILAWLTITDQARLPHIMLIALASGTAAAIDAPLRQSFVHHLVGRDDLPQAIALNSVGFNMARIVGPASAGFIIAQWGQGVCFVLNSLSFGAVLLALTFVQVDTRPRVESTESVWADLRGGLHYLKSNPVLRGLIGLLVFPSLLAFPFNSLLPIFARDILNVGAEGFGTMLSATGVGALAGATMMTTLQQRLGRGRSLLLAMFLIGLGLNCVAWSTVFGLTLLALAATGFAFVIYSATTNTLLQTLSSDAMRGRILGAYVFTFLGLSPVGNLLVGTGAQLLTPQMMVSIGGLIVAAASVYAAVNRRDIKLL